MGKWEIEGGELAPEPPIWFALSWRPQALLLGKLVQIRGGRRRCSPLFLALTSLLDRISWPGWQGPPWALGCLSDSSHPLWALAWYLSCLPHRSLPWPLACCLSWLPGISLPPWALAWYLSSLPCRSLPWPLPCCFSGRVKVELSCLRPQAVLHIDHSDVICVVDKSLNADVRIPQSTGFVFQSLHLGMVVGGDSGASQLK